MPAGPRSYGEVDHLGGEYECAHHTQERDLAIFKLPLRPSDDVPGGRHGGHVESRPDRRREKPVGDVHGVFTVARTNNTCHRRKRIYAVRKITPSIRADE